MLQREEFARDHLPRTAKLSPRGEREREREMGSGISSLAFVPFSFRLCFQPWHRNAGYQVQLLSFTTTRPTFRTFEPFLAFDAKYLDAKNRMDFFDFLLRICWFPLEIFARPFAAVAAEKPSHCLNVPHFLSADTSPCNFVHHSASGLVARVIPK